MTLIIILIISKLSLVFSVLDNLFIFCDFLKISQMLAISLILKALF